MVMLHIKLKRITNAATWYQIFCLQTPPPLPDPGDGINRSIFFRVRSTGQNIWYHVAAFLGLGSGDGVNSSKFKWGSIVQFFQDMVMLHIKLNGIMKYNNMVAIILPTDPPPSPPNLRAKYQNSTFTEHGHVAYQISWNHEI